MLTAIRLASLAHLAHSAIPSPRPRADCVSSGRIHRTAEHLPADSAKAASSSRRKGRRPATSAAQMPTHSLAAPALTNAFVSNAPTASPRPRTAGRARPMRTRWLAAHPAASASAQRTSTVMGLRDATNAPETQTHQPGALGLAHVPAMQVSPAMPQQAIQTPVQPALQGRTLVQGLTGRASSASPAQRERFPTRQAPPLALNAQRESSARPMGVKVERTARRAYQMPTHLLAALERATARAKPATMATTLSATSAQRTQSRRRAARTKATARAMQDSFPRI